MKTIYSYLHYILPILPAFVNEKRESSPCPNFEGEMETIILVAKLENVGTRVFMLNIEGEVYSRKRAWSIIEEFIDSIYFVPLGEEKPQKVECLNWQFEEKIWKSNLFDEDNNEAFFII